ncbi:hypothetical protein FNV43_RR07667 [Rhamnella rubrinervis]|uniref:Uncharacterized protein n=1 Tax=Rhamnella rubrinervis TaxID=2594499 RepID=A0A8K0HFD3_9ROSA|nr:hypothetical protein FNV43_RR07667 [Rhamnella rubrinervis]
METQLGSPSRGIACSVTPVSDCGVRLGGSHVPRPRVLLFTREVTITLQLYATPLPAALRFDVGCSQAARP